MFRPLDELKKYRPFDEREKEDLNKTLHFLENNTNCIASLMSDFVLFLEKFNLNDTTITTTQVNLLDKTLGEINFQLENIQQQNYNTIIKKITSFLDNIKNEYNINYELIEYKEI